VELSTDSDSRSSLIRQTALAFPTAFSVAEIQHLHPNIGRELIKKVLYQLRDEKKIFAQGKGRASQWKVKS
jgi:hypothetical protein